MKFDVKVPTWLKRVGYKAYKYRADITFISGSTLRAVGTGLFIRATRKNEPAIQDYISKKKQITQAEDLNEEERKKLSKDNTLAVVKTSAKNYALPVAVSIAGTGLEIYSHVSLKSDLSKTSALLTSTVAAYELLKERIIAEEGEDKWREYAYGQKVESVVETDEEGNTTESKNIDFGSDGFFSAMFDEYSVNFETARAANKNYLTIAQNCWDAKLQSGGKKNVIFLRPVWEMIFGRENLKDYPKEWANAGWVATNPDGTINHISFGIDSNDKATLAFKDEETPYVRLVFNCAPNVYDLL